MTVAEQSYRGHSALVFMASAVAVACLAAANGGYFASSWGWSCLSFSSVALAALARQPGRAPRGAPLAVCALLLLLSCWSALSLCLVIHLRADP